MELGLMKIDMKGDKEYWTIVENRSSLQKESWIMTDFQKRHGVFLKENGDVSLILTTDFEDLPFFLGDYVVDCFQYLRRRNNDEEDGF